MGSVDTDSDAAALIARMSTPPDATRAALINALVVSLKAAGVWGKLDVLYVLAAADAQAARLNWKSSSYDLTAVNSPTFTVDRGYAGDGATSYLRTNYIPSSNGASYLQNSAHAGVWDRTSRATADVAALGARQGSANVLALYPRDALSGAIRGEINGADASPSVSIASSVGHSVTSRTGASAGAIYRNGANLGGTLPTSSTPPNREVYVCCRNNAGTPSQFTTDQLAAIHLGGGLNDAEALALYTALNTYLTAVGAA